MDLTHRKILGLALVCVVALAANGRVRNPAADSLRAHHARQSLPAPQLLPQHSAEAFSFRKGVGLPQEYPAGDPARLTDQDYRDVARELGVEVPAIKAVVEIEAGRAHKGFHAPGQPIINFDMSMFRRYASKRGINLGKYAKSHASVFTRQGSGQDAVWRRYRAAEGINPDAAVEGTFWGMFQIGGFHHKLLGFSSPAEFRKAMSRSERDQLQIFARFIKATGLDKYLKNKNWAEFSRRYNGPGYARRGYHTKMAAAYNKFKAQGY